MRVEADSVRSNSPALLPRIRKKPSWMCRGTGRDSDAAQAQEDLHGHGP
jgi:hypothetical protein